MIAVCLLKGYDDVGVAMQWVPVASLLLSSMLTIRPINVSSIVFVLIVFIFVLHLVLYVIFRIIMVSDFRVFWITYWYPVFIKPLSLNQSFH